MKKNVLIFVLLLCIEIIIAIFVHDNFVRPYLGDVIVVALIYFFLKIFIKKDIVLLPVYIFAFSFLTELIQYFDFLERLKLEDNRILNIIFGSTFDLKDILCYGIGCVLVFVYQYRDIDKRKSTIKVKDRFRHQDNKSKQNKK